MGQSDPDWSMWLDPSVTLGQASTATDIHLGSAGSTYLLDSPLTLGPDVFANFSSSGPVEIEADVTTNGGGIRSATGFDVGGAHAVAARSLADVLRLDPAVSSAIQQQQVSDQNQAHIIFTQIQAEERKAQTERWQIQSDLQSKIHELSAAVTVNQARLTERIQSAIAQYIAGSTIEGDTAFLGDMYVGAFARSNGTEVVDVVGDFATRPFASLNFELAGLTPGDGHDQLYVDGDFTFDDFTIIGIELTDDENGELFIPEFGDEFDLIVADSIEFAAVAPVIDERLPSELAFYLGTVELPEGGEVLRAFTVFNPLSPCDFNTDGAVDFADFLMLADVFGHPAEEVGIRFDKDRSGSVDFPDFLRFASEFGTDNVTSVPEPASILLFVSIVCLAERRQRRNHV